jgi:hypothetical protein
MLSNDFWDALNRTQKEVEDEIKLLKNAPSTSNLGEYAVIPTVPSVLIEKSESFGNLGTDSEFISPDCNRKKKSSIKFWDTMVVKVHPELLVWAPYYRIRDKLMPARVCSTAECSTVRHIKVPYDPSTIPVEFICMEEIPESRILLVQEAKVVPYWSEPSSNSKSKSNFIDGDNCDKLQWNEKRVDLMREVVFSF